MESLPVNRAFRAPLGITSGAGLLGSGIVL
jgi:hypothetical protein